MPQPIPFFHLARMRPAPSSLYKKVSPFFHPSGNLKASPLVTDVEGSFAQAHAMNSRAAVRAVTGTDDPHYTTGQARAFPAGSRNAVSLKRNLERPLPRRVPPKATSPARTAKIAFESPMSPFP